MYYKKQNKKQLAYGYGMQGYEYLLKYDNLFFKLRVAMLHLSHQFIVMHHINHYHSYYQNNQVQEFIYN